MKRLIPTIFLTLLISACGGGGGGGSAFPIAALPAPVEVPAQVEANNTVNSQPPFQVAFLGDSLTAGFDAGYLGATEDAHPIIRITSQLNGLITPENLSLGGTSAGQHIEGKAPQNGIPYAQWIGNSQARIVVIRYGGIEALYDLPLDEFKYNIEMMVTLAKSLGKEVVLVGKIYLPESEMANAEFQKRYARADTILRDIAVRLSVPYIDVSQVPYNDGELIDPIHPGKVYQDRVSDKIATKLLEIFG